MLDLVVGRARIGFLVVMVVVDVVGVIRGVAMVVVVVLVVIIVVVMVLVVIYIPTTDTIALQQYILVSKTERPRPNYSIDVPS